MVIWAASLTDKQRRELAVPEFGYDEDLYCAIDANTDMAKTAAIRSRCTVAWIICPVHSSKYVYDRNGNRIPTRWDEKGRPSEYLVTDADPHLTVKLGTSEDMYLLHGHINVKVDERGFPTGFMNSFQRRQNGHLTNGDDRTMKLFEWVVKRDLIEQQLQKEAADYELFKTRTVGWEKGWEIDDDEDDQNYDDENNGFESSDDNTIKYISKYGEESTGLDPQFEEYIVRKWNISPSHTDIARAILTLHGVGKDAKRQDYMPIDTDINTPVS
ncbi:hypothetical protein F4804DRAFT_351383 [Jackrogersella minutella]|nr:hypothetical protein F4804DRAFT_351383 [Jackrogersella minutella]